MYENVFLSYIKIGVFAVIFYMYIEIIVFDVKVNVFLCECC